MGSNPISSTTTLIRLVLDSSPLQALHRCDVLRLLPAAYAMARVPGGVVAETRLSLATSGPARVPALADLPAIEHEQVGDDELAALGAVFLKEYRATTLYQVKGRQIDRPELEVVALALRHGALAVLEDAAGIRTARDFGVEVVGTAALLCDLEVRGFIADAIACAQQIRQTGYHTHDLQFLASGSKRPPWRAPLSRS